MMEKKITNDTIPGEKHILYSKFYVTDSNLSPVSVDLYNLFLENLKLNSVLLSNLLEHIVLKG